MTHKRLWTLLITLVLGLGVNSVPAQSPKEGKASSCPRCPGSLMIGTGVNSDAGLIGNIFLNEREFNCTKCPTPASSLGVCDKCPDCDACPGCCQKCPECDGCCTKAPACPTCVAGKCAAKHGTFTVGVGISLLPGPLPLPVPVLKASVGRAAPACCAPPAPSATKASVEDPQEKQFVIETRVVETRPNQQEQVLFYPRVTVLEGQPASVNLCDIAAAGQRDEQKPVRTDGLMQVQVEELDSGDLLLDLTVQKNTVEKSGKSGTVVLCRRLAAVQEMKPGKPMKLVLEKDDQGGARTWVEVMVRDAADKAGADTCKPPAILGASPLTGKHYGEEWLLPPGMMAPPMPPVPVTVYVPQPVPPQPAAMMLPDGSAVPCPRPVSEVIPCNVPGVVTMPAANMASIFRAIKENGHARLEVLHGPFARMTCPSMTWGVPGRKPLKLTVAGERVHVSGCQLNAYANRVIADAEDHLVMEGRVRLTYEPELAGGAQKAPRHIKADKVTIHLHDGHLDVEVKTRSGN